MPKFASIFIALVAVGMTGTALAQQPPLLVPAGSSAAPKVQRTINPLSTKTLAQERAAEAANNAAVAAGDQAPTQPQARAEASDPQYITHPSTLPSGVAVSTRQPAPVQVPAMPEFVPSRTPAEQADPPAAARARIKAPPQILHVKPGVNVIFGVALNSLNRIVTPFKSPVIETTSNATTSVKGNVIYVAPQGEAPIGFFIHESGNQETAISITMVPADIPAVSTTLAMNGYVVSPDNDPVVKAQGDPKVAEGWETDSPFSDTVRSMLHSIALGQVPDGYTLSTVPGSTPLMPACDMPGVTIVPRQVMTGYNMDTVVALASNNTPVPEDIQEKDCAGQTVLAVAAWPRTRLQPGETTELYIVVRAPSETNSDTLRPSLLGH